MGWTSFFLKVTDIFSTFRMFDTSIVLYAIDITTMWHARVIKCMLEHTVVDGKEENHKSHGNLLSTIFLKLDDQSKK